MGTSAHIQVKQPEYGKRTLSSWVDGKVMTYLNSRDIQVYVNGDIWEIEVTGQLQNIAESLSKDGKEFDDTLPEDMRSCGYGKDLGELLAEGISAAYANDYDNIIIQWF